MDTDPAIFVLDLKDANKKINSSTSIHKNDKEIPNNNNMTKFTSVADP